MKLVQKGNRQLKIADDRLEGMLAAGYAEVDEKTGKLLTPVSAVKDVNALAKENAALRKENRDLKAQLDAKDKKTRYVNAYRGGAIPPEEWDAYSARAARYKARLLAACPSATATPPHSQ